MNEQDDTTSNTFDAEFLSEPAQCAVGPAINATIARSCSTRTAYSACNLAMIIACPNFSTMPRSPWRSSYLISSSQIWGLGRTLSIGRQ